MNKTQEIIEKIEELCAKGKNNEFKKSIKNTVENAVSKGLPLNFISFTCSTINSKYLFTKKPWLYVKTNPKGNNLTGDILKLQEIVLEFRKIYPNTQLNIIIGNTDPYYIYLEQFKNFPKQYDFLWKKFSRRWDEYEKIFGDWLDTVAPKIKAVVISWYQFEKKIENETGKSFKTEYGKVLGNILGYFDNSQLEWELRKLKTQFSTNKYFEGLDRPGNALLKEWTKRKFAEYTTQGKWIYENIPNAILIQNEKPSNLRSQMYQPLIQKDCKVSLPIVYFLGIDNSGYQ